MLFQLSFPDWQRLLVFLCTWLFPFKNRLTMAHFSSFVKKTAAIKKPRLRWQAGLCFCSVC
jgi:hypothetical protein